MDFYRFRLPGFENPYARKPRKLAFLAVLETGEKSSPAFLEEKAAELRELARAATLKCVGELKAYIAHPSASHFLRQGKLDEIALAVKKAGADIVVMDIDLSPTQAGNIEAYLKMPVIDRTGLILEIFGRRAKSSEGKLQVEMAQLRYVLPRLGGLGTVMSRMGGGIGSRGPGEQELERDRRKVRRRIQQVKDRLEHVRKHRELIRSGRKKKQFVTVALVGYTNAGKSTLLNALTGASAVVADQMFATLDPKTRMENLNGRQQVLFVDTVGFLRDLPHALIEAFHATLEEVAEADVLIHVLDVSHPHVEDLKASTETVLAELEAADQPRLLALNKADCLDEAARGSIQSRYPEGVLISAIEKRGLNHLLLKLESMLPASARKE